MSFLRTWFAQNEVNNFSIAVWFQREGSLSPAAAIVNNRYCKQVAGFSLSCPGPSLTASIMTDTSVTVPPSPVSVTSLLLNIHVKCNAPLHGFIAGDMAYTNSVIYYYYCCYFYNDTSKLVKYVQSIHHINHDVSVLNI